MMGWLDDHAKRRTMELRRARLSFCKIKKVLELDNIHVTLQAVYLFLKQKNVELGLVAAAWERDQPQPPLQGQEPKLPKLAGPWPPAVPGGDILVSQGPAAGPDTKEGTQSVSPASLCQGGRQSSKAFPMELPPGNGKAWLPQRSLPWHPQQCWIRERVPSLVLGCLSLLSRCFSRCPLQAMAAPQVPSWLQGSCPAPTSPCPPESSRVHPWPGTQP